MLVHGGFDGTHHLSDLWALDLDTWTWELLSSGGGAQVQVRYQGPPVRHKDSHASL
jgi:hypothetical protein